MEGDENSREAVEGLSNGGKPLHPYVASPRGWLHTDENVFGKMLKCKIAG